MRRGRGRGERAKFSGMWDIGNTKDTGKRKAEVGNLGSYVVEQKLQK